MQQDGGKGCPNNAGQTSGRSKLMEAVPPDQLASFPLLAQT